MNNLYFLTEERPKNHIIWEIIKIFGEKYKREIHFSEINIIPEIINKKHTFSYMVTGVKITDIGEIKLKIVSGVSSFVNYLVYELESFPEENSEKGLKLLIEETKTSDKESRNTGVYQRITKFIFADHLFPNVQKIMLYNIENKTMNKPTDTNIFGTNMMMNQNIQIVGKDLTPYKKFETIDEFIEFKNSMRKPPKGNTPIIITKNENNITISGRLSKPKNEGNIAHDPSIGALTSISKTLRLLNWNKDIMITEHGVSQEYLDKRMKKNKTNKFLTIATWLDIRLDGLDFDVSKNIKNDYWYYETKTEKLGTIFLHILSTHKNKDIKSIYENHAGCERGYFCLKNDNVETIPKKDKYNQKISIPDLILINEKYKELLIIEGKKYPNLNQGITELKQFDLIEKLHIKKEYPEYKVSRWVVTYGNDIYVTDLNKEILIHLNEKGEILINKNAPCWIANLF
jgi:hypothetical protein